MNEVDWQTSISCLNKRGEYLLSTGKWADCHFLLGQEHSQQLISGHKLLLAMASPVFEAMFYGELAEKNDPIAILDVQPDAFRSLLVYIYTDVIQVDSVDKACELCYAAKKYMLPHVVETCTNFLFKDLRPKNVCRAYEFAKLFEEPRLIKNCLDIMCARTQEVIDDPSFEEAEINTVLKIMDQEVLNINTELSLFTALSRYAVKQQLISTSDRQNDTPGSGAEEEEGAGRSRAGSVDENKEQQWNLLRAALKKIRFLTFTPQEFAEGPAQSNLFTQSEAFQILMNISSSNASMAMPEGFTTSRSSRLFVDFEFRATAPLNEAAARGPLDLIDIANPSSVIRPVTAAAPRTRSQSPDQPPAVNLGSNNGSPAPDEEHVSRRYYCLRSIRTQTDCLNTSILDCSVTFTVDRSICVTGCQVPTQVLGGMSIQGPSQDGNFPERYSELLYAHLLDALGSRLTYTHCTSRVRFDSMLEISFDRPVYIQKNKMYKIGVVFNKVGWYPMALCVPTTTCSNVIFTFGVGSHNESVRDGLIRAIVFTFPNEI